MYESADAPTSEEAAESGEATTGGMVSALRINVNRGKSGEAFIGGGCCVHLSIEYAATSETSGVRVVVKDTEGTILAWGKEGIKPGYYIKEGIITTNPGAKLEVTVANVTARVRWCEVFSC